MGDAHPDTDDARSFLQFGFRASDLSKSNQHLIETDITEHSVSIIPSSAVYGARAPTVARVAKRSTHTHGLDPDSPACMLTLDAFFVGAR